MADIQNIKEYVTELAFKACQAKKKILLLTGEQKNRVLLRMEKLLREKYYTIEMMEVSLIC